MADNTTTSSESIRNKLSSITNTKDNINNMDINNLKVESKTTMVDTNQSQEAITTNAKDNNAIASTIKTQRLMLNKLKRKKKLPTGQGSFEEVPASNTKKRKTKLEVQPAVNCDISQPSSCDGSPVGIVNSEKRVMSKPPLPPKPDKLLLRRPAPPPPPRLKRKLEDNTITIQKLNARAEQLRLEIGELRTALVNERTAVRVLRAQNEAETRKSKTEIKKLQSELDTTRKVVKKKSKDEAPCNGNQNASCPDSGKLSHEIYILKDANRVLEEKIQIVNEAERRKASDIRSFRDSHEIRLTQIKKSAKTEINRLLEELKTKERNIGQLKKEIHSLKNVTTKKDIRNAQHPPEMRKLKEIERTESSTDSSNQKSISTTCGDNEYNSMPHEITQRILEAHDDLHIFRNKDATNSDTDSALSSAPPSISPQPPTSDTDTTDIWQSVKNYSKELSNLQNDNESLHRENELLKKELELAKQQFVELEKSAIEARNENAKMQQLKDRIKYLEEREDTLEKEAHELREQNELLEFRIIELEESNDKWSLRSNLTPDTRDMWTDTERECDDLSLYPDRSDSGVTSPHCQHHSEDERNSDLPYDLTVLDPIPNDELKRRVVAMTKRINCDEYDKVCLLQVLSLLNNLDILTQEAAIAGGDIVHLEMIKAAPPKSSESDSLTSSPRSFLAADPHSFVSNNSKSRNGKIVATVLPYSSTLSSPSDSPRKFRSWQTSSLQESGVFEGDLADTCSESTQTEPHDFPCPPTTELCAEIQKLNKFREKIEECVSKAPVPAILSPNLSDQRRLQYYKDRLEIVEKKLVVYESSGDQQAKKLAERLQREVQLEALVKDYYQQIELLEVENSRLEEERCEFEEAENDTRLKLQRLEIDLEILSQRNLELEMSKEAAQAKLQESRQKCISLQDSASEYQEQVNMLETQQKEYKNSLNLIRTAMPAILLFNSLIVGGYQSEDEQADSSGTNLRRCTCHESETNNDARMKLHQLMAREHELTQNITELNRAYNETLESADNLWAQMEKDYKDRLEKAKRTECALKAKVLKLEDRIAADSQSAVERLSYLEENENCYKNRICRLNKDNKELTQKNASLQHDYQKMKGEYIELKNYLDVVAQPSLEREKQKVRKLEQDLDALNKTLKELEESHEAEMQYLRNQLMKTNKELLHIEVTNSELKEEVNTLETRICELVQQHVCDEERIRNLMDELGSVIEDQPNSQTAFDGPNLAEELTPCKRINADNIKDLSDAAKRLSEAIACTEKCKNCMPGNEGMTELAKEIKKLADVITGNKKRRGSTSPPDDSDDKPGPSDPGSKLSPKSSQKSLNGSPAEDAPAQEVENGPQNEEQEENAEDAESKVVMRMELQQPHFPACLAFGYPFDQNVLKKPTQSAAEVFPAEAKKISSPKYDLANALKAALESTETEQCAELSESTKQMSAAFDDTPNLQCRNSDGSTPSLSESSPETPTVSSFSEKNGQSAIDTLLLLVAESIASDEKSQEVERELRHLYAQDIVFRQNLSLVLRLGTDSAENPGSIRSFEQISRAMECVRVLEAVYEPLKVPAIESLRSIILGKLLNYFMKSQEKLRCVVCVPKDRSK